MSEIPWWASGAIRAALVAVASALLATLHALGIIHWPEVWNERIANGFAGLCIVAYGIFEIRQRVKQGKNPASPLPVVTLTKRPTDAVPTVPQDPSR